MLRIDPENPQKVTNETFWVDAVTKASSITIYAKLMFSQMTLLFLLFAAYLGPNMSSAQIIMELAPRSLYQLPLNNIVTNTFQ